MAEIAVVPIVLNDCVMIIDDDDYAAACSGIVFTPSTNIVKWNGMKPSASFSFPGVTTWDLDLTYAQDIETTTSLTNYLHANEGETKSARFEPKDGGKGVTATIVIVPGALGGQGGAVPASTVKLGVSGKPAIVAAA